MRRDFQLIAGATAAVAAVALATQVDLSRPEAPAADAAPAVAPAPAAPATPAPDRAAELAAEITRLTAALNDREAELARLRASLDRRDVALDRVTAALVARDVEIRELRQEIAALRAEAAFDAELAALKAAAGRPDAPLLAVRDAGMSTPATNDEMLPDHPEAASGAAAAASPDAAAVAPTAARALPLARVHFEMASAELTVGGRLRAVAAAETITGLSSRHVRVVGHADRTGSHAVNDRISRGRAEAVAAALVGAGVPAAIIEIAAMGDAPDHLPVPTPRGVSEPLNRSVAIWLDAGTVTK